MTTLWHVEVEDVGGTHARLRLLAVSPDAGAFVGDPAFSLRLLYEPAVELGTDSMEPAAVGPLGAAIGDAEVYDEDWMAVHAEDFVRRVEVSEEAGSEPPLARLDVEVTDPRWLEHVERGQRWRSAAYA